ncbi:MAG TPA: ABC transporter permease [Devosia sp.]|nr:ABC transporter permease [Devosia sp.]
MISFVLRRLVQMIPVILIGSLLIWAMLLGVPGGPVAAMLGENASAEQILAKEIELGLDQPILIQYFHWLMGALRGDFGLSVYSKVPVMELILGRLPATAQLAFVAMTLSVLIGIPIAVLSAMNPGSKVDRILSGWSALALGIPTFWMGILLILLFAVNLRWLPSASQFIPIWVDPIGALRSLAMPAVTLGLYVSGVLARFLRASLITEMRSDYVRTARSKGLPESRIMLGHILPNALLPFITIVALMLAGFLGGAVVTESVFTYPGIGRLLVSAIETRDYPLVQGCIMIILVLFVVVNLLVDILYAYIDPRIEY